MPKKKKELTFPKIVLGKTLGEKEHTFNDINGGMKRLADLNLIRNRFFGGNIDVLGFIKEYGFYACPHYSSKEIIGFYVHDPEQLTETGKKLLEQRFPDYKITWEKKTATAHKELTEEEIQKKEELKAKAEEQGINPSMLDNSKIEEIESLIASAAAGKSGKKVEMESIPRKANQGAKVRHNAEM